MFKCFLFIYLACDENHWGTNCINKCSCGVGALPCDKQRGCVCREGWSGDKCQFDKDECALNDKCTGQNENCVNTPGSYECVCKTGYEYSSNNCIGNIIT